MAKRKVAEFFAGAGLARAGLEASGQFEVVWANDLDADKAAVYRQRWGHGHDDHLLVKDVAKVRPRKVPSVDLAWASFPCTDLSLAGDLGGIHADESGTWWQFVRILKRQRREGRQPPVVVAENVTGLATSRDGHDLHLLLRSLNRLGYAVDVLAIDARHFLPQSRPRLFVVGALDTGGVLEEADHETRPAWLIDLLGSFEVKTFHPALPPLPVGPVDLADHVDRLHHTDDRWWDDDRVGKFADQLSDLQCERLDGMRSGRTLSWRTAYRRTRNGAPAWEIRADQIAGCLRTVRGGSSKQAVVEAGRGKVRVRWMTPREYATLMGAGPSWPLDGFRDNQVYMAFGDAVAVPVVEWLARHHLARLDP